MHVHPMHRIPLGDCIVGPGRTWDDEFALLSRIVITYGTPEEVGACLADLRTKAAALIARGQIGPIDNSLGMAAE